jgi:hypothetical protein
MDLINLLTSNLVISWLSSICWHLVWQSNGFHANKTGVLNFITSDNVSTMEIIDIHFYCWGYGNYIYYPESLRDKNKEMVNVWTFDSLRIRDVLKYDSCIESNFQIFAILYFLSVSELENCHSPTTTST